MANQYGLSRTIPEPIKRQIRQQSGFGCVICGLGIIQYEHVDPEFKDAHVHDPNCMTILCPGCHSKVTTGMWSKQRVIDAMQNPICLTQGYSNELFDIGNGHPRIHFAGSVMENTTIPLMIGEMAVFEIKPPDEENGVFLLSAAFYDSQGNNTLSIVDNEWFATTNNWDVQVVGPTITIREDRRRIALQLTASPPDQLTISIVEMLVQGLIVRGNQEQFTVSHPQTGQSATFSNCLSSNCRIGFRVRV